MPAAIWEPIKMKASPGAKVMLESEMASKDSVTVILPPDLLREIDRRETDRGKFMAEAARNELERRSRPDLFRSLQSPHPESVELAEKGIEEWARGLPEENVEEMVDTKTGKPLSWISGEGWVEGRD